MHYSDIDRLYDEAGFTYNDATSSRTATEPTTTDVEGKDKGSKFILSLGTEFNPAYVVPIYDPRKLYEQCVEQGLPTEPWWGKVNSYTCPLGSEPGIAYFLVDWENAVQHFEAALEQAQAIGAGFGYGMSFKIVDVSGVERTANWMYVAAWQCVTPGYPDDPNALYMLTLKDIRYLGLNGIEGWDREFTASGSFPIGGPPSEIPPPSRAFNIPKTQCHGDGFTTGRWFLPSSLKPGTNDARMDDNYVSPLAPIGSGPQSLWTWAEMLTVLGLKAILWQSGGGTSYTSPVTLPYTPPIGPIDFDFQDVSPWMAIAAALDRLSLALKFNPFAQIAGASPNLPIPTLCVIGKADTDRDAVLAGIESHLVWDKRAASPLSPAPAAIRNKYIPYDYVASYTSGGATIRQWVHEWNERTAQQYGQDYAVGSLLDSGYAWSPNSSYSIIDHDVPVLGASLSIPNPNWLLAAYTASVKQHLLFARQSCLSSRQLNRIYAGFHTADGLLPGSMIKVVRWEDCGHGPRTHLYCGDGYLAPHALYQLVNPHRLHRTDDLRRWQSVESLDLRKL